jgi:ABC-2 type transport system permease protein
MRAIERLAPHLPEGATAFEVSDRFFYKVPPPTGVPVDQGREAFGKAIAPALKGDVETPDGKLPLALAVYIPRRSERPAAPPQVWTNGSGNPRVLNAVRDELTVALRQRVLEDGGLSGDARAAVAVAQRADRRQRAAGGQRPERDRHGIDHPDRAGLPAAAHGITTGSMMLQGVVEERSNKLLESVLACIRPAQLMNGKLLGLGGVGIRDHRRLGRLRDRRGVLQHGRLRRRTANLGRSARRAVDLAGDGVLLLRRYLILSMTFLAIGSLSDSMQDAQSYLMPVLDGVHVPGALHDAGRR